MHRFKNADLASSLSVLKGSTASGLKPPLSRDGCVIEGGGFGHGIGFSQYGACKLAEQGKDYEEIINYYYKNIELKRY